MVKSKKNKRDIGREEEDSDVDVKQTELPGDGSEDEKVVKKGGGKKEKTKKAEKEVSVSDSEEPAPKATKAAAAKKGKKAKKTDDYEDDDDDLPIAKSNQKSAKKGGFALLNVDSDDDMIDNNDSDDETTKKPSKSKQKGNKQPVKRQESEESESTPVPQQQQQGKKGKKAKKNRNEDDEEDIEKLLAELEIEYSGGKVPEAGENDSNDEEKKKKPGVKGSTGRQHKKSISKEIDEMMDDDFAADMDNLGMKSAAQKKKEKKERQKKEAALAKAMGIEKKKETPKPKKEVEPVVEPEPEPKPEVAQSAEEPVAEEEGDDKKKKKKGKDKKDKPVEEEKGTKKGPGKAMVAAMQERLKKMKEEEERRIKEEEEQIRLQEEAERILQEQQRLELEKKEKKKQKEKERKERLKAEGKLLNKKQQADRARALALLEARKAEGVDVPEPGKKVVRPGTRIRPQKVKKEDSVEGQQPAEATPAVEKAETEAPKEEKKKPEEVVKDSWDASSSEDESEEKSNEKAEPEKKETAKPKESPVSDEEQSEESESEDSDDESESDEDDTRTDAEKKRDKAKMRIEKRRIEAEKSRSLDKLRAAVVCVLGHVDTGKTKILDKLRRTNVQDSEAGGITQQIGATNVPIDAIREQTKIVKNAADVELKLPGLLIIDTPGHESFSNLRSRGSSLCDIAILVVDIMHGLEPQTIESINLLKAKKTPFIVALNKIDRLYDWETMPRRDIRDILKGQQQNTQLEFNQRTQEVITQFAMEGLNAKLFYENPDVKEYISLVPTSAITGEGMGNLLHLICEFCQSLLAKRLMFSEELQATVLEVKALPGLGTTIDVILINGRLREGETMVLAGTEGPITTQIRSLVMPQPMKELRVKNPYTEHKEVVAAQGVKIAAKDLEKAIAGLNLLVATKPDEVELMREEVARDLRSVLNSIKLSDRGVFVQASTLGSLEALLEFLKSSKIPYAGIRIGPVVKRDVTKASTMLEHDRQFATILAFDVKVERDAQDLADSLHVKIFQADIIYHLFDKFMAYRDELKQKKRDEFKSIAVFPCKLKILSQFIFNSRDPIVMGVMIENGILKEGTPICVPSKEFVELGIVTSIESNHKVIETARKGQEVCIKIENIPGETPKLFGRHFDEKDMLVSKISRQSIDACKEYFRDDLIKADWTLMVELKKLFEIL